MWEELERDLRLKKSSHLKLLPLLLFGMLVDKHAGLLKAERGNG
jgi:hypothetical protein